jgi:hypothetical protein
MMAVGVSGAGVGEEGIIAVIIAWKGIWILEID